MSFLYVLIFKEDTHWARFQLEDEFEAFLRELFTNKLLNSPRKAYSGG